VTSHDVFIAGAGMYLPPPVSVQVGLDSGRLSPELLAATGAHAVRVAGDTPAPDLAVSAVREALARSGHRPDEIDMLFYCPVWHQGPECWSAPHYVLRHGLGQDVPAVQLTQQCNGAIAAMDLGASYLTAAPSRTAVVIATGENWNTGLVDRWSSAASCIFGDGGTALVVSRRAGFARLRSTVLLSAAELEDIDRTGERIFPPRTTAGLPMNHHEVVDRYVRGFRGTIPAFVDVVRGTIRKAVEQALGEAGLSTSDVTRICHVNSTDTYHEHFIYRTLGLDPAAGTREFGRGVGHLGSGDTLAAFTHLVENGQLQPGDHAVLVSTAPGHATACAVVELIERPQWTVPPEGR
jgi:3-oxoacyl-[acyl-carrier-protein] synthase-3